MLERSGKILPLLSGFASLALHPTVAVETLFLKPIKEKFLYSRFPQTTPLSTDNPKPNTPANKALEGGHNSAMPSCGNANVALRLR